MVQPRDVCADQVDTPTHFADAACDCFSRRLVIKPGDRDIRTILGQRDCNGGANSLLRSGDQRNPACQLHDCILVYRKTRGEGSNGGGGTPSIDWAYNPELISMLAAG